MYIHPVQLIILLVIALAVVGARLAYVSRQRRLEPKPDGRDEQELSEVKGRVQVLERIVTDKEHSLSREIEQLRN